MVFEETVVLNGPFDEVLAATKAALADQGFGVLTEIDMQHTLRSKINKQIDRYVILGDCNPRLAGAALDIEPQVGALLPCNVVVHEVGRRHRARRRARPRADGVDDRSRRVGGDR